MDYDSMYGHGERLQMQAELHRLRMQLAHANKRAENFEGRLLKLQQEQPASTKPSDPTNDPSHDANKTKKNNSKTTKFMKTPRSTFGSNPDPIVLPNGFIDGRSNAQAAFEQKCQLLREFRQEFGHCNVPPDPPPKYRRLVNFIMKQRKYYRQLQRKPDTHPQITPERIAVLEEIGLQWYTKKNPTTTWHENYQKLLQIFNRYGHCCLPAIERRSLGEGDGGGGDDDELQRWTREQRRYLKAAKQNHVIDRSEEHLQAITEEGESSNSQKSNETAAEEPGKPLETQIEKDHNATTQNPKKNNKTKRDPQSQRRPPFPAYWTPELREKLQDIRCPWLHSFEDDPRAQNLDKKPAFLSTFWFSMLQKCQKIVQERGTTFLPDNTADKRLIEWARDNRRLYDAVQDGKILDCDEYKTMFQLLHTANFVLDREVLRKEIERIEQLKLEKAERKRYEESCAGKLEAAKKVERAAKDAFEKAKEKASLANKELRETRKAFEEAHDMTRQALLFEKADVVGKKVTVKFRGEGHPHGAGKVLNLHRATVLSQELSFYDVEFEDGQIATNVDGAFVHRVDEGFRLLSVAAESVLNNLPPKARPVNRNKRKRNSETDDDSSLST